MPEHQEVEEGPSEGVEGMQRQELDYSRRQKIAYEARSVCGGNGSFEEVAQTYGVCVETVKKCLWEDYVREVCDNKEWTLYRSAVLSTKNRCVQEHNAWYFMDHLGRESRKIMILEDEWFKEQWFKEHGFFSGCDSVKIGTKKINFGDACKNYRIYEKIVNPLAEQILAFVEHPDGTRDTDENAQDLRMIDKRCQGALSALAYTLKWDSHDNICPSLEALFDKAFFRSLTQKDRCIDDLVKDLVTAFLTSKFEHGIMGGDVKLALGYDAILLACYKLGHDEYDSEFFKGKMSECCERIREKYGRRRQKIPAGPGKNKSYPNALRDDKDYDGFPAHNLALKYTKNIYEEHKNCQRTKVAIFSKCHHLPQSVHYHEHVKTNQDIGCKCQTKAKCSTYHALFGKLYGALDEMENVYGIGRGINDGEVLNEVR